MDIFNVLTLIGGLALFLYGMNAMGEGLSNASGGRLEKILEKLTSNQLKSVLLGAVVTAVIQSSSATTVMVVGFVNSGIMKLSQAVGIIMGANVGTTITSWILSLAGIESSNIFIKFLKPTSFSPILAIIGIGLLMFSKKESKKHVGNILVGFAILMFGMDTMSTAVKPLRDVPEFTNLLLMFSNPILGLLAGTILTAVIQSSSASVGILQALCLNGVVSYGTAIPIIMGQNIGTCVTAVISGIGATKNAKRAAGIHLLFNVIGTFVFMIGFYSINAVVNFEFLGDSASAAGIAVLHTCFNIFSTLLLLPFSKYLVKLACFFVRDQEEITSAEENNQFQLLDVRFLDTPAYAIEQCKHVSVKMAELSQTALFKAMDLLQVYDEKQAEEVKEIESMVDHYEDEIATYLVRLSSHSLSKKDSFTLNNLLHSIGDFERISDHAVNIMKAAKEIHEKNLSFSEKAAIELKVYTRAIRDIVNITLNVFENEDIDLAQTVEPLEEVIDFLKVELKSRHIRRLREGKSTIEMGFILSDIITNYERVSDHCSNIAIYQLQLKEDGFDIHEFQESLKAVDNEVFIEKYTKYKENYVLP